MSQKKICNRSIAVILKSDTDSLKRLKEILEQSDSCLTFPNLKIESLSSNRLGVMAHLPEELVDPFISFVSSKANQSISSQSNKDNLDILVVDKECCECVFDHGQQIKLPKGWQVRLLPPGEKVKLDPPDKTISMYVCEDVFGSGLHSSTQLAFKAILYLHNMGKIEGASVIDIGTGSGILAILTALLDAKEIIGIDIDMDILETALKNAKINGVATKISFTTSPIDQLSVEKADIIVANLTPSVLYEMLEDMISMISRFDGNGWLVLSGHSHRCRDDISKRLKRHGFQMVKYFSMQGWSAEIFRAKDNAYA